MISAQFTAEMCVAAQNREKIEKNGHFLISRSFKVIDVGTPESLSVVFITISTSPCLSATVLTLDEHMVKTRSFYLTWV